MVRKAILSDSLDIANLHISRLQSGFLSKIGLNLLTKIYRFLIHNHYVWVYQQNGNVVGFISLTLNSKGMMKQFLLYNPTFLFRFVWKAICSPSLIKSAIETFNTPSKSNVKISNGISDKYIPELLSIAVSDDVKVKGIGSALLFELERFLIEQNVEFYKVVAGEKLESANSFYQKKGFNLFCKTCLHGSAISNVYVKFL